MTWIERVHETLVRHPLDGLPRTVHKEQACHLDVEECLVETSSWDHCHRLPRKELHFHGTWIDLSLWTSPEAETLEVDRLPLPRKALPLHQNVTYSQQTEETAAEALVCLDRLLPVLDRLAQDQVLEEVLAEEVMEQEGTAAQSQLGQGLSEDMSCLGCAP